MHDKEEAFRKQVLEEKAKKDAERVVQREERRKATAAKRKLERDRRQLQTSQSSAKLNRALGLRKERMRLWLDALEKEAFETWIPEDKVGRMRHTGSPHTHTCACVHPCRSTRSLPPSSSRPS